MSFNLFVVHDSLTCRYKKKNMFSVHCWNLTFSEGKPNTYTMFFLVWKSLIRFLLYLNFIFTSCIVQADTKELINKTLIFSIGVTYTNFKIRFDKTMFALDF